MPEEASLEFDWFLEMARSLAERYTFRWIAIDGQRIKEGHLSIDDVVVADGDTLGETAAIASTKFDPLSLFYAFIDPPLDPVDRQ